MTHAIETIGLTKAFGTTRALDGVDLRIRKGSVYGLLGPNGAGKTTTIRILATLLRPDQGQAFVLGHDVVREAHAVRSKVSLTGQYASVDEDLTGHENLVLVGRLLGLPWRDAKERATELLQAFALEEAARKQVRTYSGGMRRRIDIAGSLVAAPDVLFLDEPTTGLDPRSRSQVWDIVRRIAGQGTTVLLTTQYLDEADRLAERLAVVDHGKVIAEGTSRELKASVGATSLHLRLRSHEQKAVAQAVLDRTVGGSALAHAEPGSMSVTVSELGQAARVLQELDAKGVGIAEFSLGSPSLDDVFFALTGRPAGQVKAEQGSSATQPKKGAAAAQPPAPAGGKAPAPSGTAASPSAPSPAARPSAAGGNGAGPADAAPASNGAGSGGAASTPSRPRAVFRVHAQSPAPPPATAGAQRPTAPKAKGSARKPATPAKATRRGGAR